MTGAKINANPQIYETPLLIETPLTNQDTDDSIDDEFTTAEIFDLIRTINDPEHPLTLEQLNVVQPAHITITNTPHTSISVEFTPTIPHCSMATLIGLSLRVKLHRSLPRRVKVSVQIRQGTHQSEKAVNKQLNDKERVAAALENQNLLEVVNQCLR